MTLMSTDTRRSVARRLTVVRRLRQDSTKGGAISPSQNGGSREQTTCAVASIDLGPIDNIALTPRARRSRASTPRHHPSKARLTT